MEQEVIAGSKANAIHDCRYSRGFTESAQGPADQPAGPDRGFSRNIRFKRWPLALNLVAVIAAAVSLLAASRLSAAPTAPSSVAPVSDAPSYAAGADTLKAHNLVSAAINMTDSERAVKLLWQATEVDPTLDEPYMYLALYYDSRSQFDRVVQVYQKLLKYQPRETTAYINIGEAYMSFSPPRYDSALPYYLKALQLEPGNAFAALRIGELYAQKGDPYREQALRYLNLARSDRTKNPTAAAEADKVLHQMGAS